MSDESELNNASCILKDIFRNVFGADLVIDASHNPNYFQGQFSVGELMSSYWDDEKKRELQVLLLKSMTVGDIVAALGQFPMMQHLPGGADNG